MVKASRLLITPDGLRRAALVQRVDGLVSLYEQTRWAEEPAWSWPFEIVDEQWVDDEQAQEFAVTWRSLPGLFGTLADAEAEARASYGYSEAYVQTQ
jgi:hypothetical protein